MADPFSILRKEPQTGEMVPKYDSSKKVERYRKGITVDESQDDLVGGQLQLQAKIPLLITEISMPQGEAEEIFSVETSSESEAEEAPRFKPVFLKKDARLTEAEKAARAIEDAREAEELARLEGVRREESKRLCDEALRLEEAEHLEGIDEVDDGDEQDHADYDSWKLRELRRLVRDREERIAREKERREIDRRRNLTDWERQEENRRLGTDETSKPKQQKHVYLQKYYNKGSFFQDRDSEGRLDPIFMRDYNAPVEGDFDRSILPASMQKRRGEWGMKGQTKYTHLTAEDTTDFDPLHRPLEQVVLKQQLKGAGFKAVNSFNAHFLRR